MPLRFTDGLNWPRTLVLMRETYHNPQHWSSAFQFTEFKQSSWDNYRGDWTQLRTDTSALVMCCECLLNLSSSSSFIWRWLSDRKATLNNLECWKNKDCAWCPACFVLFGLHFCWQVDTWTYTITPDQQYSMYSNGGCKRPTVYWLWPWPCES